MQFIEHLRQNNHLAAADVDAKVAGQWRQQQRTAGKLLGLDESFAK